jgi:hypothetical protein
MTKLSNEQLMTTIFDSGLLTREEVREMGVGELMLFQNALADWLEENPVELLENSETVEQIRAQFEAFQDGSMIGTGGYGSRMRAGKAKKDATGSA